MGRVECCCLAGHELYFNSLDHRPPHLHVRCPGAWEIRVDLLRTTRGSLEWTPCWPRSFAGPSGSVRRQLARLVHDHREALLLEWEKKVCPE
ncbi:MAG: DUF4160 domain-containing protein [Candidatus Latescibacterota bacterium]